MQNLEKMKDMSLQQNNKRIEILIKNLPIAKLRFVPKKNSVRPIMTFYKKF